MNVLFIFSTSSGYVIPKGKPLLKVPMIHVGTSSLSAMLKYHGHKTRLAVLTRDTSLQILDEIINEFKPDIISFTSIATEFNFINRVATYVKNKYPYIFRIIGGVHVSIFKNDSMLEIFNALCVGEGEYPLLELVQSLEKKEYPSGIKNLWIKQKIGKIEKNPCREFIQNLDELPIIDREIWKEWHLKLKPFTFRPTILLGRGCPFLCTYCSNHALRTLTTGKYVRLRSPTSIIKEIQEIKKDYPPFNKIYFEVETFGADINWSMEFCDELKKFNQDNYFNFEVNLRITPALRKQAEGLFAKMQEAGFRSVNIGLESGSPRIRENILKRSYSNDDLIYCTSIAQKYNLTVLFYVMIALPEETVEDFNITVDTCIKSKVNVVAQSIFYPYPGTVLYDSCVEKNILPSFQEESKERIKPVLYSKDFTYNQVQKAYIWFPCYVLKNNLWKHYLLIENYIKVYGHGLKQLFFIPIYFLQDIFFPSRRIVRSKNEIFSIPFFLLLYIPTCIKLYIERKYSIKQFYS